jgi:tRNA(Ile)-lysidine synthase
VIWKTVATEMDSRLRGNDVFSAMADLLDTAASRFAASLEALTGCSVRDIKIGLAVSGGPDSMAMLILAHRMLGGALQAATVDHRLRPEAAEEAAFVAAYCAAQGIAHQTLIVETPITGNVQSAARTARYALLNAWADETGRDWIATAHHADDQLETLLMRIARGAGISGLSAIRPRNGKVIRPMLSFTKAELEAICEAADVSPCRDPSNSNDDFDRVRMRQWLAQRDTPFEPRAALRSVTALAQSHEALEWTAERLATERLTSPDFSTIIIDPLNIPAELQRRLLLRAIASLEPSLSPRGTAIDRALDALRNGEKIMIGNWLCTGGATWTIAPAPPRRI